MGFALLTERSDPSLDVRTIGGTLGSRTARPVDLLPQSGVGTGQVHTLETGEPEVGVATGDDDQEGSGAATADDTAEDPTSTTTPTTTTSTTSPEVAAGPSSGSGYYNDFSSGALGPDWEQYNGIGNGGWGLRRPSALSIVSDPGADAGGRCLAITASMGEGAEAGQMVSGGVKLLGHSQTYGRYTVRLRVDDDPDQVTSGVALLWPASNNWPEDGEINIVENYYNRNTRSPVEARLHWLSDNAAAPFDRADDELNQVNLPVDATEWHTYTLDWRADSVTIAVDGGTPFSLSTGNAKIPHWPMDLTLQLDGFDAPQTGVQPLINRPVSMCVDYVRIEP